MHVQWCAGTRACARHRERAGGDPQQGASVDEARDNLACKPRVGAALLSLDCVELDTCRWWRSWMARVSLRTCGFMSSLPPPCKRCLLLPWLTCAEKDGGRRETPAGEAMRGARSSRLSPTPGLDTHTPSTGVHGVSERTRGRGGDAHAQAGAISCTHARAPVGAL